MERWRITGIMATLIIVLSLPIYALRQVNREKPIVQEQAARFVTSEQCRKCHQKEYDQWLQSHHARSMAVATAETVLGNFNDTVFIHQGVTSRFYRQDGRYFVHTSGPGGTMADFEITHTFGWYPLQQYLVPFPGSRLQCLPIAWDVRKKKWFHLYPDLTLDPQEWIYWTNQGQNWNSMCADCHSTELRKNYTPENDSYETSWSEINVGCESCHGPGSRHLRWAEQPEPARIGKKNGLTVQTSGTTNRQQVELCAPCHSRRSMLGDYVDQQPDLLDTEIPRLLEERLYYPDGQILDEVYVYGSFVQSKMYANGVRCSDCHDPHSITLHEKGNALCLQCHQAAVYDTRTHHFHKQKDEQGEPIRSADGTILFEVGSGAECVGCHMPGRTYMGNDYRPDHSIRIPRPDLNLEIGVPDSCSRCHVDKDTRWATDFTKKWYGEKRKYHFGPTFQAGRDREESARADLIRLAGDHLTPPLVRATTLSLLAGYQGPDILETFRLALQNEEPLIRRTALLSLPRVVPTPEELVQLVSPFLDDPVKGVRIEAARTLTVLPQDQLPDRIAASFQQALTEFRDTATYSADFAASRLNLGTLDMYQGDMEEAEKNFKKAVEIDPDFAAARTNLAVLYSRQGKNELAEEQLRTALARTPDLGDVNYSLGLLLSEQKKYEEAVLHLARAASAMPDNGRVHYNLGQLLAYLGQQDRAEQALRKSVEIEPEDIRFLTALAQFYLQQRRFQDAAALAEKLHKAAPNNPLGQQLLDFIHQQQP